MDFFVETGPLSCRIPYRIRAMFTRGGARFNRSFLDFTMDHLSMLSLPDDPLLLILLLHVSVNPRCLIIFLFTSPSTLDPPSTFDPPSSPPSPLRQPSTRRHHLHRLPLVCTSSISRLLTYMPSTPEGLGPASDHSDYSEYSWLNALGTAERRTQIEHLGPQLGSSKGEFRGAFLAALYDGPMTIKFLLQVCFILKFASSTFN